MAYLYGLFLNPQDGDPAEETEQQAAEKALAMSIANKGTPVGVWDDSDRTLRLFAGYEEFVPA
tara:strand:- start:377 stop:565 length:189 start_codon:yes stop_codon:yes gene_type:complete